MSIYYIIHICGKKSTEIQIYVYDILTIFESGFRQSSDNLVSHMFRYAQMTYWDVLKNSTPNTCPYTT